MKLNGASSAAHRCSMAPNLAGLQVLQRVVVSVDDELSAVKVGTELRGDRPT